MKKMHLITETEWTQARFPQVLIPDGFKGILLVIPSSPNDEDERQKSRALVDAAAKSIDHVATWRDELGGWCIQQKGWIGTS